jgi:hypothetical protein
VTNLVQAVSLLGRMDIDQYPNARLATLACELVHEFRSWQEERAAMPKCPPPDIRPVKGEAVPPGTW